MKTRVLNFLVCPLCQSDLQLEILQQENDEVLEGNLLCPHCAHNYPIRRSIPRFLLDTTPKENLKTTDAFGWEWQRFRQIHSMENYTEQFLDWVFPLTREMFKNKVVLDAGCGMGRFSQVASSFGAQDVLAVDLSDSVEAARLNLINCPNVHVIQADINHLPLRRNTGQPQIDLIYSIGVLHHMPDPEMGFHSLVRHLRPKGIISVWVYGRENNDWVINIINPLRERITARMSPRLLYLLTFLLTLVLHPLLKLVYYPANHWHPMAWLKKLLPYNAYMGWLSKFGFRHTHAVIFDHLTPATAFYIRREEFSAWFERARLVNVQITPRNNNSWRGLGVAPETSL
ncbi:MAG: methyltransferase domain-containing protein [Anaerolineae bacterium]|nr:methyltransferase domain-containing protein [Anaerolineae bacterium]